MTAAHPIQPSTLILPEPFSASIFSPSLLFCLEYSVLNIQQLLFYFIFVHLSASSSAAFAYLLHTLITSSPMSLSLSLFKHAAWRLGVQRFDLAKGATDFNVMVYTLGSTVLLFFPRAGGRCRCGIFLYSWCSL